MGEGAKEEGRGGVGMWEGGKEGGWAGPRKGGRQGGVRY